MAVGDSSGASNAVSKTKCPLFPSYVNVPLSTNKLDQPEPSSADYANFLKWYKRR